MLRFHPWSCFYGGRVKLGCGCRCRLQAFGGLVWKTRPGMEGRKEAWMGEGGKASALIFSFPLLAVFDGFCGELSRICCLYYWRQGRCISGRSVSPPF